MIARRSRNGPNRRTGFGLIEMAISGLLIAAAMAVTVQVVGWVASDRRSVARRERAVIEASNLMERIAARAFDEITPESLAALKLPEAARASLPGSTLNATVDARNDAPSGKRITVEIRWRDRAGQSESPVRLVAWTYPKGGPGR